MNTCVPSEALTVGDAAPTSALNYGTLLPPERSKQYEVGVKYDNGKYGASLAAFQIEKPETYTNAAGYFVADGTERHRGIEASRRGYRTCATEAHAVFHDQGWFVDGSGRCRGDCCGVVERQPQPAVETLAETVKESQHAHRSQ